MAAPTRSYRAGAPTYAFEHRAFVRREGAARVVAAAAAQAAVWLAVCAAALPYVSRAWGHALAAVAPRIGAGGVTMHVYDLGAAFGVAGSVGVPSLRVATVLPGPGLLLGTAVAVGVLAAATVLLPSSWRPAAYLARAVLLVQASAVVFFAVWPGALAYTLSGYLQGGMAAGLGMTVSLPVVFALTLYVQDLALWRTAALTALALAYSAVFVPLQYAAHAALLDVGTALFLPALYLFAGLPLHVFALVALYAWGMSWPGSLPALGTPIEPADPIAPAAPFEATHP